MGLSFLFFPFGVKILTETKLESVSEPLKTSADMIALFKKINFERYAKGDPERALRELIFEVEQRAHHFRKECWNITIELIADHLGIITNPWKYAHVNVKCDDSISKPDYPGFQKLKEQVPTDSIEAYVIAAKSKPWDYLGDVFVKDELAGRANSLGQCLTPKQIVDMMIHMTMGNMKKPYSYAKPSLSTLIWLTKEALAFNEALPIELHIERARRHTVQELTPLLVKYESQPITQLDPAVGTGRFLLESSLIYPEAPLVLFGIEIDISLYRACLVNMAMFSNHPYSIICADTLRLDPEKTGTTSKLWDLGNRWNPPDITEYYWKPISPFQQYMKQKAKAQ